MGRKRKEPDDILTSGGSIVMDPVGEYVDLETCPSCKKHPDCIGWMRNRCVALKNSDDHNDDDCPFYKNKDDVINESKAAYQELIKKGRMDLIEKYKKSLTALGAVYDADFFDGFAHELDLFREENLKEQLKEATELNNADWDE